MFQPLAAPQRMLVSLFAASKPRCFPYSPHSRSIARSPYAMRGTGAWVSSSSGFLKLVAPNNPRGQPQRCNLQLSSLANSRCWSTNAHKSMSQNWIASSLLNKKLKTLGIICSLLHQQLGAKASSALEPQHFRSCMIYKPGNRMQ